MICVFRFVWLTLLSHIIWTSNGGNHFFHGSKHQYSHKNPTNTAADRLKNKVNFHYEDQKFALSHESIAKYEYELEFRNDIVMIQLDEAELSRHIHHIECTDSLESVNIVFKKQNKLRQFTAKLKREIEAISPSNYSFVMASSDDNQWMNCKQNMKEMSLLRMFNLNDCTSDYHSHSFQCNNIQTISHTDLISIGHIKFHANTKKPSNTSNNNSNNSNRRRLVDIQYNLRYITACCGGGTASKISVVIEGSLGSTDPHELSNQPTDSSTTYIEPTWTDKDVGTIQKMYFVNNGYDQLDVYEITINSVSAGVGSSWTFSASAYNDDTTYPKGCGVATIDFINDDFFETTETPRCETIPPALPTGAYHEYVLKIETISSAWGGPSEDNMWAVIEGTNGKQTDPYSLGALNVASTWFSYNINETNVGEVTKLYIISFKQTDDDMCTDNINIDNGMYLWWSYVSQLCVSYEEKYPTGCYVGYIDFALDTYDGEYQIPCEIVPPIPAIINPNGRTYHVELEVTSNFGYGGSEDLIGIFIRGSEGNTTSIHNISAPTSSTNYVFDFQDAVDVGYIVSAHLVTFGSDDMCFDKLVIDTDYIWDSSCLTCWSYCAGYNGWQESGCGVVDIDFRSETAYESEEIPCSTVIRTGSVFEDSWAVNVLDEILDDMEGGNVTGKVNHTGTETSEQELTRWSKTFSFSVLSLLDIDTTISIESDLILELTFSWGWVDTYFVGLTYDAGLEILLTLSSSIQYNIDKTLIDLKLWGFGIWAGPFSIGVFVGMELHAGGSAEAQAILQCSFSYNVFGRIGLQKTPNYFGPTQSLDKNYQFSCSQFSASVTASVFVYPILYCRVDYVWDSTNIISAIAKPYVEASIKFDGLVDTTRPNYCYLTIEANVGLQVLLTSAIVGESWTLYNGKWPIFDTCLDNLLSIGLAQLAQIIPNEILNIASGSNLCSTSYGTSTTHSNSIISGNNICIPSILPQVIDDVTLGIYNYFGKINSLWNGRIYAIKISKTLDMFDSAIRLIDYVNYQVQSINVDDDSVNVIVLFNTIINNYLGTQGLSLNCFYTLLQTINQTYPLQTGISYGIFNKQCVLPSGQNNITAESYESSFDYWVYNFNQMNVRIAKRELFAELLIKKPFQTDINFKDLQFNENDNKKIFYGGIWCNVCDPNDSLNCDNKIKSFQLIIYSNGMKARLKTNYMSWPISHLDITYNNITSITCLSNEQGNIACGKISYTINDDNTGNRYYFGEIEIECYAFLFCGTQNLNNNILPLFVFNEDASNPYDDVLYSWESSIITVDNTVDNCNGGVSNEFVTTTEPSYQPSYQPSDAPTYQPSYQPSDATTEPTNQPSNGPIIYISTTEDEGIQGTDEGPNQSFAKQTVMQNFIKLFIIISFCLGL